MVKYEMLVVHKNVSHFNQNSISHYTDDGKLPFLTYQCEVKNGYLATQTFLRGPYFKKTSSSSYLDALLPKFPMYTLQETSQSRWRDIFTRNPKNKQSLKELKIKKETGRGLNNRLIDHKKRSVVSKVTLSMKIIPVIIKLITYLSKINIYNDSFYK